MAFGQGLAQFPSAFLGGMGGAGSLVQTLINLKSGGQTVLSTFVAGLILFVIAAGAYPSGNIVPWSAIAGVMFYSAININGMHSHHSLRLYSREKFGIVYFLTASDQLEVDRIMSEGEDTVTYRFKGPIFFASYPVLLSLFTHEVLENDPKDVILFLTDVEILDWSGQLTLKTKTLSTYRILRENSCAVFIDTLYFQVLHQVFLYLLSTILHKFSQTLPKPSQKSSSNPSSIRNLQLSSAQINHPSLVQCSHTSQKSSFMPSSKIFFKPSKKSISKNIKAQYITPTHTAWDFPSLHSMVQPASTVWSDSSASFVIISPSFSIVLV
jgi:hypothetical protein